LRNRLGFGGQGGGSFEKSKRKECSKKRLQQAEKRNCKRKVEDQSSTQKKGGGKRIKRGAEKSCSFGAKGRNLVAGERAKKKRNNEQNRKQNTGKNTGEEKVAQKKGLKKVKTKDKSPSIETGPEGRESFKSKPPRRRGRWEGLLPQTTKGGEGTKGVGKKKNSSGEGLPGTYGKKGTGGSRKKRFRLYQGHGDVVERRASLKAGEEKWTRKGTQTYNVRKLCAGRKKGHAKRKQLTKKGEKKKGSNVGSKERENVYSKGGGAYQSESTEGPQKPLGGGEKEETLSADPQTTGHKGGVKKEKVVERDN